MLRWAHLPECQSPAAGWQVSTFNDIAEVIAGQSPPSDTYNKNGIGLPFLQGNADFGFRNPTPTIWCSSPAKIAQPGDTLISVRAPVGEVNLADHSYAIGRGIAAARATGSHPGFIFHALQRWRWCLQRVAQGTTFDAVTARHFGQLYVAVPSDPDEQAAIARVLDAVDAIIERTHEAELQACDLKRALIQRLFTEGIRGEKQKKRAIGFVPQSWDVREISSVVKDFQYGLSVPMELRGSVPILRMGNIQRGEVLLEDLKYVSLPDKILAPYIVHQGDVLFNRTNSQEHVGKVGIYRSGERVVFASYLIRLIPDTSQIDSFFLGQLLNSYSVQCRIKRYATPGVEQVNINATNLGKVLIPVPVGEPGLKEQSKIAGILETTDNLIRAYRRLYETQQSLKKSLLHDLLTGRVRVTQLVRQLEAAKI